MKELIDQVEKLSIEELIRANEKFSMFGSSHEGYAVIKEEIEETEIELKIINRDLNDMWYNVKNNSEEMTKHNANNIKSHAINMAAESIQVAAMAQKIIDSFKNER